MMNCHLSCQQWMLRVLFLAVFLSVICISPVATFSSRTTPSPFSSATSKFAVAATSSTLSMPASFDTVRFQAGAEIRKHNNNNVLTSMGIIIDVENVRGKSGFAYSHWQLLESLTQWTALCGFHGMVTLVVDHGFEADAYWMPDRGLSVVFAGRSKKADDVIVQDLIAAPQFLNPVLVNGNDDDDKDDETSTCTTTVVVTGDKGLIDRCKRMARASSKKLHILSPLTLLQDLEWIDSSSFGSVQSHNVTEQDATASSSSSSSSLLLVHQTHDVKLGGFLLEAEARLRLHHRGIKNKQRKRLKLRVNELREKLSRDYPHSPVRDFVTKILDHQGRGGMDPQDDHGLSTEAQNILLQQWDKVRTLSTKANKERTGDRLVLADRLQRELKNSYGGEGRVLNGAESTTIASTTAAATVLSSSAAQEVVEQLHSSRPDVDLDTDTLKLVVVSDTHGFEEKMGILPDGDVLLHLGDFATDGPGKGAALARFDTWLASQPYKFKIIVRGNHDPRSWVPVASRAAYITRPQVISVGRFRLAVIPYASSGALNRVQLRSCDILATHAPPKNILDRCVSGKNAGSASIRKCVERMKAGPPALWLCGHIHEARGMTKNVFCLDQETVIVNAAQANAGFAKSLDFGPVQLELEKGDSERQVKRIDLIKMEGRYTFLNQKAESFFLRRADDGIGELLLAVDLGLRTGLSLFNDKGELIRYQNYELESLEQLQELCTLVLRQWEADENQGTSRWALTHVAIEGGDPPLRLAWREAAETQAMLSVKPSDWRDDLLLMHEKASGDSSKHASLLIAEQIISDYGREQLHQGKLGTDVAESILIGLHVARRLGWIEREPPIRRTPDGRVVLLQDEAREGTTTAAAPVGVEV